MNSKAYDMYFLSKDEVYIRNERAYGRLPVNQHDNASWHRSGTTDENLGRRETPTVKFPPHSPGRNLFKHVRVRMRCFIHDF